MGVGVNGCGGAGEEGPVARERDGTPNARKTKDVRGAPFAVERGVAQAAAAGRGAQRVRLADGVRARAADGACGRAGDASVPRLLGVNGGQNRYGRGSEGERRRRGAACSLIQAR